MSADYGSLFDPLTASRLHALSNPTLLESPFVLYNATIMQHQFRPANNNNNDNDDPRIVGRSFAD